MAMRRIMGPAECDLYRYGGAPIGRKRGRFGGAVVLMLASFWLGLLAGLAVGL